MDGRSLPKAYLDLNVAGQVFDAFLCLVNDVSECRGGRVQQPYCKAADH